MLPSALRSRGAQDASCEACRRPLPLLGGIYRGTCKRRDCPSYVLLWGRDQFTRLLVNLYWYRGRISMTTLTAPGFVVIPEGDEAAAQAWNDHHWKLWTKLNRVAKLRADRQTGQKGGVLAHARELQKRGVWHLHIALAMQTAVERAWAVAYVNALHELGPRYMFGYVDRKPLRDPREAGSAAHYMAKYLTKSHPEELAPKLKRAAGRPLIYIAQSLTRQTGVTARALRLIRRAYREANSLEPVLWPMSDSDRKALARCVFARELTAAPRGP